MGGLVAETEEDNTTLRRIRKKLKDVERLPEDKLGREQVTELFRWLRDGLKKLKPTACSFHDAASDAFHLYASTKTFFKASSARGRIKSTPFTYRELGFNNAGKTEGKSYENQYSWGQLVFWMRQTIEKPNASLSAARRGVIVLPNIECCYSSKPIKRTYAGKSRAALLEWMIKRPFQAWPTTWHWSFQTHGLYGTPSFDSVYLNDSSLLKKTVTSLS